MRKTVQEINEKIKRGEAVVLTAEEMVELVKSKGPEAAVREVDVVTTGTFGAMCSTGAFLNFGHADPPIKLGGGEVYLNDVPAYTGLAAVDVYVGSTSISRTRGLEYGGGHVLEDLVSGKEIELIGKGYGTDCYPRREIRTTFTIHDLNQAILCCPRTCYQRYNAATNSRDETLYTYMGMLLPNYGNVTFSWAGVLSPLSRDPEYRTIGIGTRIFLGGAQGYVISEGTQHDPERGMGTLAVAGDMKKMNSRYIRGCTIPRYGTSLYLGIGIPIPVLDEGIAMTAGRDESQLKTNILDYGVPSRERPVVREVTCAELRSGKVELAGKEVPVSPLSSFAMAREISETLKRWIEKGEFLLSEPVEPLSRERTLKPMRMVERLVRVKDLMTKRLITIGPDESLEAAATLIKQHNIDHLPVVEKDRLVGIVTSWDLAVSLGTGKKRVSEIMTRKVITANEEEPVDVVVRRLEQHKISGVPVVDGEGRLRGILTTDDISKFAVRR
ncbi:MAG: homocysteine biosynthesis protein [Candidatus Hadarchaeales archaeon]